MRKFLQKIMPWFKSPKQEKKDAVNKPPQEDASQEIFSPEGMLLIMKIRERLRPIHFSPILTIYARDRLIKRCYGNQSPKEMVRLSKEMFDSYGIEKVKEVFFYFDGEKDDNVFEKMLMEGKNVIGNRKYKRMGVCIEDGCCLILLGV